MLPMVYIHLRRYKSHRQDNLQYVPVLWPPATLCLQLIATEHKQHCLSLFRLAQLRVTSSND